MPPQLAAARTPGFEQAPPPVTHDCGLLASSREGRNLGLARGAGVLGLFTALS
jgi:hypothetical protein